jgi:hypothetical protein
VPNYAAVFINLFLLLNFNIDSYVSNREFTSILNPFFKVSSGNLANYRGVQKGSMGNGVFKPETSKFYGPVVLLLFVPTTCDGQLSILTIKFAVSNT